MRKTVLLLMLVFGLASCASQFDSLDKPDKDKFKDAGFEYEGNTIRFTDPGIVLEVSYLSQEGLDLYYSMYKGGRYKNPLPPGAYTAYSLSLQNKSQKSASFNPQAATLLMKGGNPVHPKDFTMLYAELSLVSGDDVQERMDAFRATCLDSTVTLRPGERVDGLLVFPAEKGAKTEQAELLIESLYVGSKLYSVPLFFGKAPAQEKDKGKAAERP